MALRNRARWTAPQGGGGGSTGPLPVKQLEGRATLSTKGWGVGGKRGREEGTEGDDWKPSTQLRKIPEPKSVLLSLPKRLWEKIALGDPVLTWGGLMEQRRGLRQDCLPVWCSLSQKLLAALSGEMQKVPHRERWPKTETVRRTAHIPRDGLRPTSTVLVRAARMLQSQQQGRGGSWENRPHACVASTLATGVNRALYGNTVRT